MSAKGALIAIAVGVALTGAGVLWHAGKVAAVKDEAFKAGEAKVQTLWDKAVSDAAAAQKSQNEKATETHVEEVEVIRYVYRDRVKEVKVYVPQAGTSCPADPDFVRLFNGAPATGTAGDAKDQPGPEEALRPAAEAGR